MFARLATFQGTPNGLPDPSPEMTAQLTAALKAQSGFKGGYTLMDRASGKVVTLTFWENEAALKASAAAGGQLRAQVAQAIGSAQVPGAEEFEALPVE